MEIGKKKLHLLVPTLQLGGQERVAVNTADIMRDIYDVTMVIFDSKNAVFSPSCKVINLDCPALPGFFNKVRNVIRRVVKLSKLYKAEPCDFCLSFGPTANLINVLSQNSVRKVVGLRSYRNIKSSAVSKTIFSLSNTILCCSRKIQSDLVKQHPSYREKTCFLPNPYHAAKLLQQGSLPVADFVFGPHVIATHGRLDEVKNHQRLIKAFSNVVRQLPDAQLLIIGEGSMRSDLETLIQKYDLANCVTLLGFRENPFAYLSKASVYALTSYTEGFPNALVEAMFFLPVVSVDCNSGPREILSDGSIDCVCAGIEEADHGILISPAKKQEWNPNLTEDDQILADAILSVLNNPQKQQCMKEKARLRAEQFSCDSYRDKLIQILEK